MQLFICRIYLSREIKHSDVQSSVCACAGLFSCYLSSTVIQLLFDFVKHAVARFASFLAPFLSVLTILWF